MRLASGSWLDVSGIADWISIVGLPLTLFGLWLAWYQARAASNSAEAARKAVYHTEQRLRANQLLVLVPQLRLIAAELDTFIEANDSRLAKRQLDSWRRYGSTICGLLILDDPDENAIYQSLQKSLILANRAGANLLGIDDGSININSRCAKARREISQVCDTIDTWANRKAIDTANDGIQS